MMLTQPSKMVSPVLSKIVSTVMSKMVSKLPYLASAVDRKSPRRTLVAISTGLDGSFISRFWA